VCRERHAAHHGEETLKYRRSGELEGRDGKVHEGRSSVWALCVRAQSALGSHREAKRASKKEKPQKAIAGVKGE
jgi:hypothetical protein